MESRSHTIGIALTLACGLISPGMAIAQYAPEPLSPDREVLVVDERMEYGVRLGRLRLGRATMAVEALDHVAGIPVYRASLDIEIGAAMLTFEDHIVSWIASQPLRSLAFEKRDPDSDGGRRRHEFDDDALDELAALYLMRTLPLKQGATYAFDRYFSPDGNPMSFRVVGHEKVRVPAGRFETIVIEPVLPSLSVFRQEAGARLYVTDDDRRILVQIETRTKVGKLTLYMTDYEEGTQP
jgi:hypothetical protein